MSYSLNLGVMKGALPARAAGGKEVFRLAVMGDFSGRALSGKLETGDALAKRKPMSVDVDNLDQIVQKTGIKLVLPIGSSGGAVEIAISSMDDFHPDQLFENVEVFSSLAGLRSRLKTTSSQSKAPTMIRSSSTKPKPLPPRKAIAPAFWSDSAASGPSTNTSAITKPSAARSARS